MHVDRSKRQCASIRVDPDAARSSCAFSLILHFSGLVHIHVIAGAGVESVALEPVASHLAAPMAAVGMEAFVAVAVAAERAPDPLMPRRA